MSSERPRPPASDRPTRRATVTFEGVLTRAHVEAAKASVGAPRQLIVDCRKMIDYEREARHAFVGWIKELRPERVAILTDRQLWKMVIAGMSLAAGMPMEAFSTLAEAEVWLDGQGTGGSRPPR